MGTLFRIKLYAADQAAARQAFREAFGRIADLDKMLSDYQPDSELNRFSRSAVHHSVKISPDLFRVLDRSQKLAEDSGGAFDVTIGALTHLWRAARKAQQIPIAEAIEQAKARSGYRYLHLDAVNETAELDRQGMQLDLGGIAKGYAADQALLVLSNRGIHSALVAASGDLAFGDAPPGEAGWKVGIDSYDRANAPFTRILLLSNAAVSTSGPSEQHLEVNGVRYSHILNPATGIGLTEDITATVIARRGIDADPMATTISVLGPEAGLAFVDRHPDVSAVILSKENGRPKLLESKGFSKLREQR